MLFGVVASLIIQGCSQAVTVADLVENTYLLAKHHEECMELERGSKKEAHICFLVSKAYDIKQKKVIIKREVI